MDKEWKKVLEDGTEVIRTSAWSPPGCHPVGCGLKLHVKDGKLVKVEGDPDHPITGGRTCVRCLSLAEYVYHPDRILYPMKRDKSQRGNADAWERISWEKAYEMLREETLKAKEKYGPEGIILFSGTGRMSCMLDHMKTDLAFETPNYCLALSGWSCYGPRIAVTAMMAGAGVLDIDWAGGLPGRYDDPDFALPECILVWGKEPLKSNPDGMFGHSVLDMMQRGSKLVVVDPRMTWLATRADLVLRLRPGTDGAVALAMLNVIFSENLYDAEWCEKWAYGLEELKERCSQYTPEWAAEVSWVPAEKIVEAARMIATAKPCGFAWGLAVDQNSNGVQVAQCFMAMAAVTGNLDVPGGAALGVPSNIITNPVGTFRDYIPEETMAKRVGLKEYPAIPMLNDTCHPDIMLEVLETDEPYPIRMAFIASSNFISPTCSVQPQRWYKAMQKMEFVAATDTFLNPTTQAFCDLFFPLATFAEYDNYVVTNYGINIASIGAINKAIEVGEAKSELEFCLEICEMLNPGKLPYKATVHDHIDYCLKESFGSFEKLREEGVWQPGPDYCKYETGRLRPDGQPGFNTPTGLLELYCTMFEMLGDDPLPYYLEPKLSHFSESVSDEDKEKYPLVLTTGARHYTSFHSEHRQIPTLRHIDPDPIIEIHPETAAAYGIKEGDWVRIENMYGQAIERAHITPIVTPQVVMAAHGWWFPEEDGSEPNLYGVWKSNLNTMVPHRTIGVLGYGAPFKNTICTISRVDSKEG